MTSDSSLNIYTNKKINKNRGEEMKLNRTPSVYDRQWRNDENENWETIESVINENVINTSDKSILSINKDTIYPLVDMPMSDGNKFPSRRLDKLKSTLLDVKVYNAENERRYKLDSVRYGYNGIYAVQVSSYNNASNGRLYESGRRTEITLDDECIRFNNEGTQTETYVARNSKGLIISVTFDVNAIEEILNIDENENGTAKGMIIHPSNYIYSRSTGGNTITTGSIDNDVYVDKTSDTLQMYIPTRLGSYTGILMRRRTAEFAPDTKPSNGDVWAVSEVSLFHRDGDSFIEDDQGAYIHSSTNTTTMDTIFRIDASTDYSGGHYHGDEKIVKHTIVVGNSDVTDREGRFSGASVEVLQETILYEDSFAAGHGDTPPFVNVKKTHIFNAEDIYRLKSKIEMLKSTELEFSNIGAMSMPRLMSNGNPNNWSSVQDLEYAQSASLSKTTGTAFSKSGSHHFKFLGYFKDVTVEIKTDSDYFDSFIRTSEGDCKLYTRIFPKDKVIEKGTIVNSEVSYKFLAYRRV